MPKNMPHKSALTVRSQIEEQYINLCCIPRRTRQQEKKLVGIVRFARMVKAAEDILKAEEAWKAK